MAVTKTWSGATTGDFNVGGNWTPTGVPDAGNPVVVDTLATIDVSQNLTNTIDSLQLVAGAVLDVDNGHFQIENTQSSSIQGVLAATGGELLLGNGFINLGDGEISVPSGGQVQTTGATLVLGSDLFHGGGTVAMTGGSFGGRVAVGGTGTFDTLLLSAATIEGSGVVGANAALLDRLAVVIEFASTIDANISGQDLVLRDLITNEGGLLTATNGGTLDIIGSVDQTFVLGNLSGGTIYAQDNSTVLFDESTPSDHWVVTGGTLMADSTATLSVGTTVTLDGSGDRVQLVGLISVQAGATLDLTGRIVAFRTDGAGTIDPGPGSVVLTGATIDGDMTMRGNADHLFLVGNGNTIGGHATLADGLIILASTTAEQTVTFGIGAGDDNIVNPGTIMFGGTFDTEAVAFGATIDVNSGSGGNPAVSIGGGGTIVLTNPADRITGGGSSQFSDVDNSILGIGTIDQFAGFSIGAGATVEAVGTGAFATLLLDAATIDNAGVLGAAAGATLEIKGQLNNTGTLATQGLVVFGGAGAGFNDGTLAAGSTIEVGAPGATFNNTTNNGLVDVLSGAVLTVSGQFVNAGEVVLMSDPGTLDVSGGHTTLSGGGTVALQQSAVIASATTADVLVNADNVINGSGTLGGAGNVLNLVNFSTIDATDPGAALVLNTGTGLAQNLGLMQASTGTLWIQNAQILNTDIVNDTIEPGFTGVGTLAANGGTVWLDGASVTEGLITSSAGGFVEVISAATLLLGGLLVPGPGDPQPYARDSVLTNYADFRVLAGNSLTLGVADPGAVHVVLDNFGSISLRGSTGNGATMVIAAPTVDLTAERVGFTSGANGTLSLGNIADRVIGQTGTETLQNHETIEGFGQLGGGLLHLVNDALIVATDASAPLVIDAAGTFDQSGTLAIGGGGGFVLEGTVNADFGQMVTLGGGGAITLGGTDGGAYLMGGSFGSGVRVLSSGATSTIDGSGGSSQNQVSNNGTIQIGGGQTIAMLGLVRNLGTVTLQAGAHMAIAGTLDLQSFGAGQVLLGDPTGVIDGAAGAKLINEGNIVAGAGHIGSGQLAFDNSSQNSVVNATGALTIDSGAHTIHNAGTLGASTGGVLTLASAVDNTATIGAFGGTVVVLGAVTDTGRMAINDGRLELGGSVAAGQTISFQDGFTNPETLVIDQVGQLAGTINTMFTFDTIDLPNVIANGASYDGVTLTLFEGSTLVASLALENSSFAYDVVPDGSGGSDVVVACFATGTRIRTALGDVPVETLRAGDRVVSAFGGTVPVQWIGYRHLRADRHRTPVEVWPIRIRAGALADCVPTHDLLLSPEHAVYLDGVLVPARLLVNGTSITQEICTAITYWHVELPQHDVILAAGAPCESYLDTGNRSDFENAGPIVTAHPGFATHTANDIWLANACASQCRNGARLEAIRRRLHARADQCQAAVLRSA